MSNVQSKLNVDAGRVADALPDSWVYRWLPEAIVPYAQLARWDRPIGWWLLLWPCWWSLALAVDVFFQDPVVRGSWTFFLPHLLGGALAFLIGAVAMRGAGCTYNDLIDTNIDSKVARTASRPLPSGRVTKNQVRLFIILQALVGLAVLIYLSNLKGAFSQFAFNLGLLSLVTVAIYPFAKLVTNWPQFVLGLAFSWGAMMGWAVMFDDLHVAPLALYAGSICWVIGYDTIYAHQDREDDALVGVKSTALLFGKNTRMALIVLYALAASLIAFAFHSAATGIYAYIGLALGAGHMIWQISSLDIDDGDKCLRLFQSNKMFGWIVVAGLIADIIV